jgi:acyl-CoA reductase-like NAD-dependent aldehyde dehydrogenase
MISQARFDELERMIRDAESEGAEVCCGGTRWTHVYLKEGAYFGATVIGGVEPQMEIAQRERGYIQIIYIKFSLSIIFLTLSVFAPIALIMKYDSIQEAIDIANGTRYGLGASVFGPDQRLAVQVARRLTCGMVAINDFGVFYVGHACESRDC